MTLKESAQILAVLTAAYPNAYKNMAENEAAGVALVWASQFADVPADIVFMALQKAISTCKFPPTICDVKEKLKKLYFEAYEKLSSHSSGFIKMTDAEREQYKRVSDLTYAYKYIDAEPELKTLLPLSQQMFSNEPGANAELGNGSETYRLKE